MFYDVVRSLAACGCLVSMTGTHVDAGQADPVLSAPYQVEGVSRFRTQHDSSIGLGEPRVLVDLGTAEDTAWPDRESHRAMTLVGTSGSMTAHLEEIVKTCETLCGDDVEECHYVARMVPTGDLGTLGDPMAALTGVHLLTDFAASPENVPRVAIDTGTLSSRFVLPVWPTPEQGVSRYRFRDQDGSLILDSNYGAATLQEIRLGACEFEDRDPFVRMLCEGAEALIADGVPVLVSFPDYNVASAELTASFGHGGRTYHLVRLGIKAQTIYGLLYQNGGRWHAVFQPRDYALLC